VCGRGRVGCRAGADLLAPACKSMHQAPCIKPHVHASPMHASPTQAHATITPRTDNAPAPLFEGRRKLQLHQVPRHAGERHVGRLAVEPIGKLPYGVVGRAVVLEGEGCV